MNILEKERKLRELETKIEEMNDPSLIRNIKEEMEKYKRQAMTDLTAWDRVLLARHQQRPTSLDFIHFIFDEFIELHGDYNYRDDESIVAGIAMLNNTPVTVIAQQKGKNLDENLKRNFAMPHPEGYRKSLRLMKQAEKFRRPIITFIDTPGAYPGLGAEERGQGEAIARNLLEMSGLTVPIIAVIIGEGGSGGALALGVANRVLMLENAIYSILSPEGYASILWKDSTLASKAAEVMKLTSYDLEEFGIIDRIIAEPIGGAHFDPVVTYEYTKLAIIEELEQLMDLPPIDLRDLRIKKYRDMGFFQRFNYENLGGVSR
ncbi:acetyl-CoA carboxylase carboxyltransferase subunit alpha [Candidatus Xianfuyuplasma coldseepsis]|uniref:Acetyl-coenzyme A carboxylase carboxyl transferase subunit alpha n=1 Tax=Candidatus Xianfuyuplasma coldseepsis TaxID=2782163 RepID=A0A7L7KTV6_9MOLU|nr:acetyl-CoA carboxylase carboxyltransferase subunit alpha [Xianfuyuplasma coldseepsis]QMS85434.1 acetyl-CoA carboxylase carboxyltransferase subunit alpha [Xianfuyuplasma coldseepsis]